MSHPTQDQLIQFARGRAEGQEVEGIYSHLAECTVCWDRYRAVLAVRDNFDEAWAEFLSDLNPLVGPRRSAHRASEQPGSLVLTIRGLVDGTKRLATAARDLVEQSYAPGSPLDARLVPAYEGVGDAWIPPGTRELARQASEACSMNDLDRAVQSLSALSALDTAAGASAGLSLLHHGKPIGEVVVHSERRSVAVLIRPDQLPPHRYFATLRPQPDEGAEPRLAELLPVEGARYLLAEFDDCPDGAFSLQLELLPLPE